MEIVETEDLDMDLDAPRRDLPFRLSTDRDRLRPRSVAFEARISSAVPFLRSRSLGTSLLSFGASFGFLSWAVREGRAWYGRSSGFALHS